MSYRLLTILYRYSTPMFGCIKAIWRHTKELKEHTCYCINWSNLFTVLHMYIYKQNLEVFICFYLITHFLLYHNETFHIWNTCKQLFYLTAGGLLFQWTDPFQMENSVHHPQFHMEKISISLICFIHTPPPYIFMHLLRVFQVSQLKINTIETFCLQFVLNSKGYPTPTPKQKLLRQ